MTTAALTVSATVRTAEEHANELPVEPWVLGVGTFVLLLVLLFIAVSFNRNH
jgi:hypothetical protein